MEFETLPLENSIQEDLYKLVDQKARGWEDFTLEHDEDGRVVGTPRDELTYVSEGLALANELDVVIRTIVARARVAGYTWAEIASAAGLKTPQVAFNRWGHDTEVRDRFPEPPREKPARPKKEKAALPGLSALEAARRLGVDPRTVQAMGKRGELRTSTAKQLSGRVLTRYFLDE